MVQKVLKPSGKDVEERESLIYKKRPRVLNTDKKSRAKPSSEPPPSLGAFNYFGKNIDDPQVKLKLLELTPRNPAQETSAGVQEFVKHMTSIIRNKKYPFREENGRCSVRGEGRNKIKNVEKSPWKRGAPVVKNTMDNASVDFSKKHSENKTKRNKSESLERRADGKMVSRTSERKKNCDVERKCSEGGKKETGKGQSGVEPKRLRRSEIPLLKSRKNMEEKRNEIVSLLMQKPLRENDSATSIDFYPNAKYPPEEEFDATPELETILGANDTSFGLFDIGEVINLKSSRGRTSEAPEQPDGCLKNSPPASRISDCTVADKKGVKASKTKTLDLEKVKTSSFTVLRRDSDSFSRLESFHKQNITAKEIARAEIAIRASKVMITMSKTSLSSIKLKKTVPASATGKGKKSKKGKKFKNEPQENFLKKKGSKISETPHLDICKEIIATGKVGCLIPKRVTKEKEGKKVRCKSPSFKGVGSGEKTVTKAQKNREYPKKNKFEHPEGMPKTDTAPTIVRNALVVVPTESFKSARMRTSDTVVMESAPKHVRGSHKKVLEEMLDEQMNLANVVVTGTALNFDDLEVFEKPPEVDKIKLEIKIDVTSEEDGTDSDVLECDSSGDVSGASLDWLLVGKKQNEEKQMHESVARKDKTTKENSWDLFGDAHRTVECKWQPDEVVLQGTTHRSPSSMKRRPNFKTSVTSALEKRTESEPGDRCPFSGDPFSCPIFFQSENKPDAKLRSGLTKSSNQEEKIFDDPTALKLRRRNSEPYSFRGFIWKRADVTSPKSVKASVSSVASSLRHLNTDDMDDFIFWEAVPQKFTSCWEMSLYHFKRPWSVLSCSVFRDNRRSNTPGLILETLRSGAVASMRRPLLYQSDRINRHNGNIFDVEPSISQKNIDIRNWLAALNFTTPISNTSDIVSEGTFSIPPVMDSQKQASSRRRNVVPQFRLTDRVTKKKIFPREKQQRLDKWNISDVNDLKELIRRESGSYVTKEQYTLSELSNPRSTMIASAYSTSPEKFVSKETGDQNTRREAKTVKSVETSCQSEFPEEMFPAQGQTKLKNSPDSVVPLVGTFKTETAALPPEVNIWKYLFLFTLIFIIFHYSSGNTFVIRS